MLPWRQLCEGAPRPCLPLGPCGPNSVSRPRAHGDTQHCRKALHRAVQCTSDYPEHVCEVLLTMERTEGGDLSVALGLGLVPEASVVAGL